MQSSNYQSNNSVTVWACFFTWQPLGAFSSYRTTSHHSLFAHYSHWSTLPRWSTRAAELNKLIRSTTTQVFEVSFKHKHKQNKVSCIFVLGCMIYTSIYVAWGYYYSHTEFVLAVCAAVMCGCVFCMEIGIMVIMGQMDKEQSPSVSPHSRAMSQTSSNE